MIDVDTVYGTVGGIALASSRSSAARHCQLQDKLSSPLSVVTYAKTTTALSTNPLGSEPQELQSPRQSGSVGLLKSLTSSLTSKPWQSKTSEKTASEKTESRSDSRSIRSLLTLRRQTQPQQPPPPPSLSSSPQQQSQQEQQQQPEQQCHAQEQPQVLEPSNHSSQLPQEPQADLDTLSMVSPSSLQKETTAIAPTSHPRPLPTPPKAKRVRWAVYHEVMEIENIDDLAALGYYDDYDSELGWNYRNESLDDTVSGEDGFEYDYDYDYEDDDDDDDDLQPSPSIQLRTPVNYSDLMYHQPLHPSLHQPFYQTQMDVDDDDDHHHSRIPSEEGRYTESEASAIDDESIIAEDDIIYRFGMDGLYTMSSASLTSLQNYQGILQRFQHFDTRAANKANATLDTLAPHVQDQVTSDTKELSKPLTTTAPVVGAPSPSRLKSPPPPSRLRYSPPLPSPSLSPSISPSISPSPSRSPSPRPEQQQKQNVEVAFEVEEVEVLSTTTETPESMVTEMPESMVTEVPRSSRGPAPSKIPRLDRSKIMEEVAQRKRSGSGVFAKRRASMGSIGDHYNSDSSSDSSSIQRKHGLWRIDTSSTSTPSLDSGSSSSESSESESSPCSPSPPVAISGPRLTRKQPMLNRWSTGQYCIRAGADPVYSIQAPHVRSASPMVC